MAHAAPGPGLEYPQTSGAPEELESVLQLCLSGKSHKYCSVSADTLLGMPLFARVGFALGGREGAAQLKFPLALKAALAAACAQADARLKTDHKLIRGAKREVRIQEILNSEEEMKKQKRRAKKRDSVWKSTSSLAETVRSHSASTASSPTPPVLSAESSHNGSATPAATSPCPADGRSALLDAICGFDKSRLARVDAR